MRARPINFSVPMVRAILDGRKTQFRQVLKVRSWDPHVLALYYVAQHPDIERAQAFFGPAAQGVGCPYGKVGDRLWVRERWCLASPEYHAPEDRPAGRPVSPDGKRWAYYQATEPDVESAENENKSPWKSAASMPRWASRIALDITGINVQRLQGISEAEAKTEGVDPRIVSHGSPEVSSYVLGFKDIWWEIHGGGSWHANPWVWSISFAMVKP